MPVLLLGGGDSSRPESLDLRSDRIVPGSLQYCFGGYSRVAWPSAIFRHMFSTGKKVDKFAHSVVRHWALWVIAWIGLAVVCGWLPPSWSAIALDGDFDHLPHNLPSVEGDRLLDGAFPDNRTRSQMAIVLGRRDAELDRQDRLVSLDISRRMYRELAEVRLQRAMEQGWKPGDVVTEEGPLLDLLNQSLEALNQAIELDEQLFKQLEDNLPTVGVAPQEEPRLTIAYADRSVTAAAVGKADLAEADKLAVERLADCGKDCCLR